MDVLLFILLNWIIIYPKLFFTWAIIYFPLFDYLLIYRSTSFVLYIYISLEIAYPKGKEVKNCLKKVCREYINLQYI